MIQQVIININIIIKKLGKYTHTHIIYIIYTYNKILYTYIMHII